MKIDNKDRQIIAELARNSQLSNLQLAERIALSPSACHRRVKLLEESGIIRGYRADIDYKKLGYQVTAFIQLNLKEITQATHRETLQALQTMPEVQRIYIITGEANYLLHVRVGSLADFSRFVIEKINKLSAVTRMVSQIVLSEYGWDD